MSVPKYKRSISNIQYVQTALDLYDLTADICSRFPNRWRYTRTFYITDLAERILENVVCANSIYATSVEEIDIRIKYILDAKAAIAVLHTKLDDLVQRDLKITRTVNTKEGEITEEKPILKKGRAAQWAELLTFEEKLLSGVLKKDREKRKEFLKNSFS